MKIIHCADVHLGSKMDSRMPRDKALTRRTEVILAFNKMIEFAKREGVGAILICGDLFDSDRPFKRDKEFFFGTVAKNPDIDFYYLRGNHDTEESFTRHALQNLKCFSDEWQSYDAEDVRITGIELSEGNRESLYASLSLDPQRRNLVMLHGAISDSAGADKINVRALRGRGIDYLALGHIHKGESGRLDERGAYAYPGCLEGRGFDECGAKGFLLLDTEMDDFGVRFIKNSIREIREIDVDITGVENDFEAYNKARDLITAESDSILRINLIGAIGFSDDRLAATVESYLSPGFFFISVKDKTFVSRSFSDMSAELSLRGEFLRLVLSSELTEDEKREVISTGLCALSGREIEI